MVHSARAASQSPRSREAAEVQPAIAPMPSSEASLPSVFIDHLLLVAMDDESLNLFASLLGEELLAILSPKQARKAGHK